MGFLLRIESGVDVGTEHACARGEATLGRTNENTLVLKDPAASRAHARVFEEGGRYYVEDLGSANGTRLNEVPVKPKTRTELQLNDTVTIGDSVIRLQSMGGSVVIPGGTVDDDGAEMIEPNPTRSFTQQELAEKRELVKQSTMRHRALSAEELATVGSLSDSSGELVPAAAAPALRPSRALDAQAPRASRGIARVASTAPPLARSRGQSDAVSEAELASAAERARERRELNRSAIGRLQLAWEGLPRPARGTLILVVILAGLGGVASIVVRLLPEKTSSRAEVMELVPNSPALADGFGQGPGAEFVRPDQKTFVFKTTSPTQVVGVLHCQARNLSKDEVTVSLNGTELGALPADTLDIESREIEVVLPAAVLKPRDENLLLFDNLKNPPEKDDWLIWNTWVEIIPVPELSLELAVRRAKEEIEKAQRAYEYRDVASENLFRAWKTYREAWLLMEATPKAPKELHTIALTRMRELRPALDRRCSAMRLEFMRTLSQRPVNMDKARAALSDIPSFFPTREHPCLGFSQRLLRQLDDISDRVYTGPTGTDRN